MEVYESHLGGIYFEKEEIPWDYLYCDECGDECEVDVYGQNMRYVEANDIESLKDKAWHLLVDLLD